MGQTGTPVWGEFVVPQKPVVYHGIAIFPEIFSFSLVDWSSGLDAQRTFEGNELHVSSWLHGNEKHCSPQNF